MMRTEVCTSVFAPARRTNWMRRPIRSVPRVRIAPQRVEASQLRLDSVNDSSALIDPPKVSIGNSGLQVCTENRHVVEARGSRWGKASGPKIDHRVIHWFGGWFSGLVDSTRQCPKTQAGRRHAHAGRPNTPFSENHSVRRIASPPIPLKNDSCNAAWSLIQFAESGRIWR